MKLRWYTSVFMLLFGMLSADDVCITHTVLKPRAITSNNIFQHNLGLYWWYHTILCEHTNLSCMLQVSSFYQRSFQPQKLASYLLPCKRSVLSVQQNGTGDVGSPWINLVAADGELFSSYVRIQPVRSVVGAYIDFRLDLSEYFCHYWFDLAFAVFQAKHALHMCQTLPENEGTACGLATVQQALDQPRWLYGKFSPCTLTAQGIDTIQLKWGYDWFSCDTNHISPYFVMTIPTAGNNDPEYIFEPIVHVKHTSLGFGVIGDYKIIDGPSELTLLTDLKYRYELPATELRSFDLCINGPWSRYLKIAQENNPTCSYAGINFFTLKTRVKPKSTIDWWSALHYAYRCCDIELGYDFWWRQPEQVDVCCLPDQWGIYDIVGAQLGDPVSASNAHIYQSTVGNPAPSDTTFVQITKADLNLASGAAPRAISNTLYVSAAYNGHISRFPTYVGVGSSVELAHNAFSNWACWVRLAASF